MKKIDVDQICSLLRPKGNENEYTVLKGFLGESPKEGYLRLYSDLALNDFIDIEASQVVNIHKVNQAGTGIGQSIVWVKAGIESAAPNRLNSKSILYGNIADKGLQGASFRSLNPAILAADGGVPVTEGSECGGCSELCSLGCPEPTRSKVYDPAPIERYINSAVIRAIRNMRQF